MSKKFGTTLFHHSTVPFICVNKNLYCRSLLKLQISQAYVLPDMSLFTDIAFTRLTSSHFCRIISSVTFFFIGDSWLCIFSYAERLPYYATQRANCRSVNAGISKVLFEYDQTKNLNVHRALMNLTEQRMFFLILSKTESEQVQNFKVARIFGRFICRLQKFWRTICTQGGFSIIGHI